MPRNKRLISTAALSLCLLVWACLSGAGTAPACAQAGCASANFAPTVVFPVGDHPQDIAAADFNGDGNTDLVTVNNNSSNVSVLLGNGAGGFTGPANFAAGLGPNSIGVADFNGDGRVDLAVANQNPSPGAAEHRVSILTGAGDGTFSAPADFPAGKFPQYLVVADFNGDGKPDVAVDNPETQEIRVLLGNGNGTLGAAVVTPASAAGFNNVFALAAGDFNGDGKTDLVGARVKKGEFSDDPDMLNVFIGSGTGSFTAGQTYPVGLGPTFVAVRRVNSDALDDLVVVNRTSGSFSVLLGAGGGNFSPGLTVKTGGIPETAVIADFNGDGLNDLAVPRQNSLPASDVAAFIGDGAGGFTASGNFALGGTVPFGALTADFNKDGKPDLATSNFTSANASVLLNACGGPPPQSVFQFEASNYALAEDVFGVTIRVVRTGLLNTATTVDYATSDGTASERSDYTTALGTLSFAPGESFKDINVLVSEDSLTEGAEGFNVTLSNPTAGAALGARSAAAVQISDDASEPSRNAIDDAETFVGQHYHDFLNRQADFDGRLFWTNEITQCGVNAACIDLKRTNVSQAFFLSIEFQRTGYQVIRVYKASFADTPQHPRGLPRYREFLRDTQELQRGVVVGQGTWEQRLRQNTLAFARRWVAGAEFAAQFPQSMTAQEFVDKLFANAGATPTAAERDAGLAAFGAGDAAGRADALLSVTDSGSVFNRQFNPAAVLMQYFGYLRRNPNDAPEQTLDFSGFDFWLGKLDSFSLPGEDVRNEETARNRLLRAEMVRAFILSDEYRKRFGQ